jgi:hypothetical protein
VAWVPYNLHGLEVRKLEEEIEVVSAAEEPALLVDPEQDAEACLGDVINHGWNCSAAVTEANLDADGFAGGRNDAHRLSLVEKHP